MSHVFIAAAVLISASAAVETTAAEGWGSDIDARNNSGGRNPEDIYSWIGKGPCDV
jgi:hypothetical protein